MLRGGNYAEAHIWHEIRWKIQSSGKTRERVMQVDGAWGMGDGGCGMGFGIWGRQMLWVNWISDGDGRW